MRFIDFWGLAPWELFACPDLAAISFGEYTHGITAFTNAEVHAFIFSFVCDVSGRTYFTYEDIVMGNRRSAGARTVDFNNWINPEIEGATSVIRVALAHTHPWDDPVNTGDASWAEHSRVQLNVYAAGILDGSVRITQYVLGSAAAFGIDISGRARVIDDIVVEVGTSTNIRQLDIHEQRHWAGESIRLTDRPHSGLREFTRRYDLISGTMNRTRPNVSFTDYGFMVRWVLDPMSPTFHLTFI